MSPFEHGEVFVLDDGGEVGMLFFHRTVLLSLHHSLQHPARPAQVDLDLGNYERFLDVTLTRDNNLTTGKVYQVHSVLLPMLATLMAAGRWRLWCRGAQGVIERERRGDYLGKTVQVVPHVTDAIQEWIERVAHIPVDGRDGPADVCVIELGGTVGDIESMPFIEALRQVRCWRVQLPALPCHQAATC